MKLKDYVTLGNLACGFASVIALMFQKFDLACYLVLGGFFFDVFDGIVARLTHQTDKFGAELDNLCDLITYSIAPGFIIYYAFYNIAHYPLAVAGFLGFLPIAIGTVRAARYNVRRAEFSGFFIGLPRPAAAFFIMALFNSAIFQELPMGSKALYAVPAALIVAICFMLMSTIPFVGHHGRKFTGWLRFGMWFFLLSMPISLGLGFLIGYPQLFFDDLTFCMLIYFFVSHLAVPKEEATAVRAFVKEWKAMGNAGAKGN